MTDIWNQGIIVDDDNYLYPENIPDEVPQPMNDLNCKSEGII